MRKKKITCEEFDRMSKNAAIIVGTNLTIRLIIWLISPDLYHSLFG